MSQKSKKTRKFSTICYFELCFGLIYHKMSFIQRKIYLQMIFNKSVLLRVWGKSSGANMVFFIYINPIILSSILHHNSNSVSFVTIQVMMNSWLLTYSSFLGCMLSNSKVIVDGGIGRPSKYFVSLPLILAA